MMVTRFTATCGNGLSYVHLYYELIRLVHLLDAYLLAIVDWFIDHATYLIRYPQLETVMAL